MKKLMIGRVEEDKLTPIAEIALKREFIRKFGNIFDQQKDKEDRKTEQESGNENNVR